MASNQIKIEELKQLLSPRISHGSIKCTTIGTDGMWENYVGSGASQAMRFGFSVSNDIFGIDSFQISLRLEFIKKGVYVNHIAAVMLALKHRDGPVHRFTHVIVTASSLWFDLDGDDSCLNTLKRKIRFDPDRAPLIGPTELCMRLVHSNMDKLGFRLI